MPTNVATHTFMKGMISDTGINLKNNESYDYAENLRHTNDYTDTLGALTNFKGFELVSSDGFGTYQVPVAHTTIRDKMYMLCTTNGLGAAYDAIYRFDVNSIAKTLTNWVRLWEGTSGSLGLSITKNTDIVGVYEASDNIKIYWATQGEPIKVANVSSYITNDGTAGGVYNDSERFNMITSSTVTNLIFSETTSGNLDSGRVQYAYNLIKSKLQETTISPLSGMINLYSDSEGLPTVQIKGDYETINSGKGVKLSLTLSASDVGYYNDIRLYRVHYTEYGQLPQIVIVGDFPISSVLTYTIIDSGQTGLGELTPEEFTILTGVYTAKTLDTKDNRLFAGNITESIFDVDFDARAYRFRSPWNPFINGAVTAVTHASPYPTVTILFDKSLEEISTVTSFTLDITAVHSTPPSQSYPIISSTGPTYVFSQVIGGSWIYQGAWVSANYVAGDIVWSNSSGSGQLYLCHTDTTASQATSDSGYWSVWVGIGDTVVSPDISSSDVVSNLYSDYGVYTTPQHTILGTTLDYPNTTTELEYNCINPYNDINNDYNANYKYNYQSDGYTIGGSGPNISYTFSASGPNIHIDDTASYSNPRSYNGAEDYTNVQQSMMFTGYQRNEVYRIGIKLFNTLGQESKVKWIGDIRFPANSNISTYDYIAYYHSNQVTNYSIGLQVTVSNLPSTVTSWEIVRVKREKVDRSIITSGYLSLGFDSYNTSSGDGQTFKSPIPIFNTTPITITNAPPIYASFNSEICNFISAEELFQHSTDIKVGDYLDLVGELKDYTTVVRNGGIVYPSLVHNGDSQQNAIKYRTTHLFSDSATCARYTIEDNRFIEVQPFVTTSELAPIYFAEARSASYIANAGFSTLVTIAGNVSAGAGYHGSCSVIQTDAISNTYFINNNSDYDIPYVYIKRNTTSRYGGYSYSAREVNEYISCNKIVPATTASSIIFGGDTYINYFNYKHTVYPVKTTADNHSVDVIFPTESPINISLRSDLFDSNIYNEPFSYFAQEEAGVHTHGSDIYTQETDLYLYNNIYSQEQNIKYGYALNNQDLNTGFDSRIMYSDKKVYDENLDSWLKFRANNFLDVDSKYGQIEVIRNFRNEIYFLQEQGFGIVPVNERSLLNDNNPGALSLGVANVLSRYAYLSTEYGCKDMLSVLNTNAALYWTDRNKKTILKFDGSSLGDLAKVKGNKRLVKSLMETNSTITPFTYITIHNTDYNETLFKLTDTKVFVFNEYFDVFSGIMTTANTYLLAANNINATFINTNLYIHDKTNNYNEFISGSSLTHMNSLLRFTNSDQLPLTKVYDNLYFFTYAKDSNGYIINNSTFSIASFKNDYQYTICTNTAGSNVLTLNDNLQRKERGYATYIPRNVVNANGTTNIDITNPLNQSSVRTYKERMRDKYLTTDLTYVNSDYLFVIPEVQISYRYSKPNIQ